MITIAKGVSKDLNDMVQLFDAYRVFYGKASDLEASENFLKDRLDRNDTEFYLMRESETAIGFVHLFPSFSSTRLSKLWILNDLYIDKRQRGKGYSKLLMEKAKELCKTSGACGILLETETTNIIGNKLYPSVGFELEKNNFYFWNSDS